MASDLWRITLHTSSRANLDARKLSFLVGIRDQRNTWFTGPLQVHIPNCISTGSAVVRLSWKRGRKTGVVVVVVVVSMPAVFRRHVVALKRREIFVAVILLKCASLIS